MTHAEGKEHSYALCDPPGTHRMLIWHPHIGRTKEQTITITPMGQVKVDVKVAAPTGRLYANQMVDHPIRAMGLRRMRRTRSCRH
jgi:hypothetical protein